MLRKGFSAEADIREARESTQLFRKLIRGILPSFLGACAIVAIGEVVARSSPLPNAPNLIQPLLGELEPGSYDGFVNTAAQAGATLLALYFATVGVVASTAYAKGPHRIRVLFVRERAGRFYTKSVALLVASSLLVIGLGQIDVEIHALTILMLVCLGVFSVLSLVELGVTIFNFFDPSSLAGPLVGDFVRWGTAAGRRGRLGSDPRFQAYYQAQANAAVQSLKELVQLVGSMDGVDPDRAAGLAGHACHLLSFNAQTKTTIPTTSRWDPRRYQHPSWLSASDSERTMAISTSTALSASEVPDHEWVEHALTEIVVRALQTLLGSHEHPLAIGVVHGLAGPIRVMSRGLHAQEALDVCRTVLDVIWQHLDSDDREALERAALVDAGLLTLINIGLGLQDRLGDLSVDAFSHQIDEALKRHDGIYGLRMPIRVLRSLEDMDKGIWFERDVEGRQITPAWFPRQIVSRTLVKAVLDDVEAIVRELGVLVTRVTELAERGQSVVAAATAYRALELCHRTSTQAVSFRKRLDDLSVLRRVHDEFWPTLPAEGWPTELRVYERLLVALVAQLLSPLGVLTKTDADPDWFGQAYTLVVSRLFNAMEQGDEELFALVFPMFFDAAFRAKDRLGLELGGRPNTTVIAFVTEPLADLLEISGYALLFSELDATNLWDNCRRKWDDHLSDEAHASVVTLLALALDARQGIFAIKPRDVERGGRRQHFDSVLRSRGIVDDRWGGSFFGDQKPDGPAHASPIIRVFAPHDLIGLEDPEDVFVVEYLKQRPEWSADLTYRASSLEQQLQRERGTEPE